VKTSASIIALAVFELMSAGVAHAAAPAADAPAAAEAPAADASADAGSGLEEITVTATKRETNLQATPISISVLNGEAIKDRHVQSLFNLADGTVPSLRIATFEARQSALTIGIRGIVPYDQNQTARDGGVSVYIDGVALGKTQGLNAGAVRHRAHRSAEGSAGHAVRPQHRRRRAVAGDQGADRRIRRPLEGGVGNYGSRNGEIHLDLPKFGGFALKFDGVIQHQDETTTNPLAGQVGWGYYNRKGGRVAVRWEIADGITNDFSYDVAKDENTPFYSQLLNYDPNNCRALNGGSTTGTTNAIPAGSTCVAPGTAFTSVSGTVRATLPGVVVNGNSLQRVADIGVPQQVSVDKTHGFTNALKWKLSPEIELRSFTAWRGVDVEQWDNSGGAHRVPVVAPGCTGTACNFSRYSLADLRQRQFSQEFQAVGTIGSVDYVAGLFYFNEHISDDAATPSSVAISGYTTAGQATGYTYTPLVPCPAGSPAAVGTVGPATNGCSIDRASEVWSKSYAAFAQVTWNATDALHITAGGRYTIDQKRGVLHWSRGLNYDTATAAQLTTAGYAPLDKEWKRFNPMVTVAYDFDRDIHAYAKYATGYRAGGASSRTQNYQAFNPEDVTSYEVGLKADFWNRRARFNIAGYIMDRKDSQVDLSTIQPFNGSAFNNLVTFNAPGTTKIQGIEADFSVKPMDGLTLNASYAYTYTDVPLVPVTYTEFSATGVPTGNTTTVNQKFYIVFTPRNAASGSIDYELPIGGTGAKIKLHLDANYSQATQSFDQFAITNDASFIVNGRINVAGVSFGDNNDQSLTFGIWGRNLFDYQYVYRRDPSNSIPQVQSNRAAATTAPNLLLVGNIGNTIGDYGNFNLPRTFGVDATLKF
jgi:iron complex outermembrane receptor protein